MVKKKINETVEFLMTIPYNSPVFLLLCPEIQRFFLHLGPSFVFFFDSFPQKLLQVYEQVISTKSQF